MNRVNRSEPWLLFTGDVLVWGFSLWLTLLVRFGNAPTWSLFLEHLWPFSYLFIFWFIIFFIAGLYEKQTNLFRGRLPVRLINAQIFNSILAVVFFYFVPNFGITPKTILFIYLVISVALVFVWRLYGRATFGVRERERAAILGRGPELKYLVDEVNGNPRYGFEFVKIIDLNLHQDFSPENDLMQVIKSEKISLVVSDLEHARLEKNLNHFYRLIFARVRFVDFSALYEEVFDRTPVSLLGYDWFIKNVSLSNSLTYDLLKRLTDIVVSIILGLVSLILYPFIFLAIKLDDRGPIFIVQERIGQDGHPIKVTKFRSMSFNDDENKDLSLTNKITRVGAFLRKSRLDELPQLWDVLRGDLSLVGPRPELPALIKVYEKEIPYYNVRHLIKPGLSGWAQLYHENHPHQGSNVEETKNKLSYDLYYIKNRSFWLDFRVALKTIKTILSRAGK
jgi:exopolysaccharide biosynthesis polyprenyl glycosylphosphotransferase